MANTFSYPPSTERKRGQAGRQLARRLAAYLPATLTRQILSQGMPAPGEPRWLAAATLFADISGFTVMAEELAADGPRGAEELNRALLLTFTGLISAISDAGGAVSHFHGDAMMVYFPDDDGRAAQRALACARFMQSLMLTSFSHIVARRPSGKQSVFDMTMRIGVGYGRCLEIVVGDPGASLEFVLAGTAVDAAVAAQRQAQAGQVVASQTVLTQAGLAAAGPFRVVTEVAPVPSASPVFYWDAFEQTAFNRLAAVAPAFIHPALHERLLDANTQSVADHRPATSLFVRFEGIDYESEAAGALLQSYYQWAGKIVARYGGNHGRLNRLLTGDKGSQLHIIFGAPVAPDMPAQAIRCALALQWEKPPFVTKQQIGLAVGKLFACAVGAQNRREYTIVGNVVNLSARLTQVCPDGAVVVDEATATRVRDLIEFEQLAAVAIKGKPEPVPIYRASSERTINTQLQSRFARWQEPPIGRDEELGQLLSCMDNALTGSGGVVTLSGPVGGGQTQLMAAGVRYWLERGGTGFVGVCQRHTADLPFAPWQSVWRSFFGLTPDVDLRAQATAVAVQAQALCPDCGDEINLWGEPLGLPSLQSERLNELPVAVRQARFFALVRHCFAAAATNQPLLIILEDIHWADRLSLDLLDELAQRLDKSAILIVLTFRTTAGFTYHALNRPVCVPITLGDLPPERARQLLQRWVGVSRLPPAVEQRLGLRDREGRSSPVNPRFLEESLKRMLSLGVLSVDEDGRVHVDKARLEQMQAPDTIQALLLARLDQLSAAGRGLLQVAAVIGREFDLATLVAVAPELSRPLATDLLAELSPAGIVQPVASEPEATYIFQHALTQDAVYQNLPYARRQALHAAIGDWLVSRHAGNLKPFYPLLAYHYSQADRREEGLEYALIAAENAAAIFAHREAAELYKLAAAHVKALGEDELWETAVRIHTARARALRLLGSFTEATLAATQALKLCLLFGGIRQTLPIYNLLAEIKFYQANYADVDTYTTKVINSLTDQTPPGELVRAYLLSGMAARSLLDHATALNRLERAEEICLATGDQGRLAAVLGAKALVYVERHAPDLALATARRAVELARTGGDSTQIGLALHDLSRIQLRLGQPEPALARITEAIELIRATGHNLLAHALIHRAAVLTYLGRLRPALADLRVAIELLEPMDDARGQAEAYLVWGSEFSSARGDWTGVRRRLTQAWQHMASLPGKEEAYAQERVRLWLGLGQMALHTDHEEQAGQLFAKALKAVVAGELDWWLPAAHYFMGLVKLAGVKESPEARRHFQAALDAVRAGGCPDYLPLILLQLARLEPDEERRRQYLEVCVMAAQKRARYQDRIRCYQEAGRLLAQSGDARLRRIGASCLALVNPLAMEDM